MWGVTTADDSLSPWRTIGCAVVVLLAATVGRGLAAGGVALASGRASLESLGEVMGRADGLLLSAGILGASAAGVATLWALLRRRSPRRYLAIEKTSPAAVALGLLASAALVAVFDLARWSSAGTVVPDGWIETFRSAGSVPLLVAALVVATPFFEECFFRGLLHRGLASSRLGSAGAVGVTALLFALAHGPTDLLSALDPLASGLVLGWIRVRTGSIVPGVAMHALGNLQAIVVVSWLAS